MSSYCHLLLCSFSILVGCAGASTEEASGSADLTSSAGALENAVKKVGAEIAKKSKDNDYLEVLPFTAKDLADGMTPAVTGDDRRKALLDCAVYGGGQSKNPNEDEDFDKYISLADREALAATLDEAIGTAKVHRIDSFGIGNIGDDYTAHCTVAVEDGKGGFLALQGHGNDRLL